MPPESLGILSSLHAEATLLLGRPSQRITFGTVKDAPQRIGRTGFSATASRGHWRDWDFMLGITLSGKVCHRRAVMVR